MLLQTCAIVVLTSGPVMAQTLATDDKSGAPAATRPSSNTTATVPSEAGEHILVEATRRNQMQVIQGGQLGALGNQKSIDVPFSIKSYTSSLILNQQAETLGQVLENDPSVRTTYGYGNFSETFIIRGFPLTSDDVALDGLYGIVPRQLISPELYDQVQVLNGASAFLNGAAPGGSAIGGGVNLVPKSAGDTPLTRVTGEYTSGAIGGGNIDVGRRFGRDNAFGFRLNVAGHSGEAAIDDEYRSATALGANFDWRGEHTRISFDMDYQSQNVRGGRPTVMIYTATAVPRTPSASHNFGQPWSYSSMSDIFGHLHIEQDITKNILLYGAFGGINNQESGNYSVIDLTDAKAGDGLGTDEYAAYNNTNESLRGGIRAKVKTWFIDHAFNMGGSSVWEDSTSPWTMGSDFSTNLYNTPRTSAPAENAYAGRSNAYTRMQSIFFSDTMAFLDRRILLTAGFRWQNVLVNDSYSYSYASGSSSHYNQDAITPVVGLVVHPTHDTSIYFNRIEGLAEGATASGTNVVNAGTVFPPFRSVQYEIGTKYDTRRFSASLAFYQISQPNYTEHYISGSSTLMEYGTSGLQKNRGLELALSGEPLKGLRIIGGATVTDPRLERTTTGAYDGNKAVGVPSYTINANVEWDVPFARGVTLTGRVVRTGHQEVNEANTMQISGWTRFDIGARYTFLEHKKPVTLRFGIDNIANKSYWASSYSAFASETSGGYLVQGLPRTFKFSVSTDL